MRYDRFRPGVNSNVAGASRDTRRIRQVATWLFVIPALVGYVRMPSGAEVYTRVGEVALLAMAFLAIGFLAAGQPAAREATVAIETAVVCALVFTAYLFAWPWLQGATPSLAEPSAKLALSALAYCALAVAFGYFFYDEDTFLTIFWRVALAAIVLALLAYAANTIMADGWLVHRQYGTPRLQGLVSEPSAWAPILPAVVILAFERKRYLVAAVSMLAAVLTKSPTVLVTLAGTVSVYLLVADRWRRWRVPLATSVVAAWAAGWVWLRSVSIDGPVSTGFFDQVVVRLASGATNVTSNGAQGSNDRWANTQAVFTTLRQHGWLFTGIGPGCEGYFQKVTGGLLPTSLSAYALGCFGAVGLAILVVVAVRTVMALRARPAFALFLSFTVGALVNSADGWESYKFFIVGVVAAAQVRRRRVAAPARSGAGAPVTAGSPPSRGDGALSTG